MQPSESRCSNCQSRRRPVYRAGFCSKCYYWHLKRRRTDSEAAARRPPARRRMSVPERVLQEYAWRERNLDAPDVDPLAIEELVYAVAAECRSEIGFPIRSLLTNQTAEARRCIFSLFLHILENTPCSAPRLRMSRPPRKGQYWDGWAEWSLESRHATFNS